MAKSMRRFWTLFLFGLFIVVAYLVTIANIGCVTDPGDSATPSAEGQPKVIVGDGPRHEKFQGNQLVNTQTGDVVATRECRNCPWAYEGP